MPNLDASLGGLVGAPAATRRVPAYAGAVTARMGLDTRLALARLYVISDGRSDAGDLAAFADEVFAAGADAVEVKDRSLSRADLLGRLGAARASALDHEALVVVHGDVDLAADFLADALLLADDRASAAQARRALHPWALVGRSCNAPAEIDAALADPDVAFLLVGPGLDHIRHAALAAPPGVPGAKPWFAAGGITPQTLEIVLDAGARRVAVGSALTDAAEPGTVATAIADRLRDVWNSDPALERATFDAFKPGRLAGTSFEDHRHRPRSDGLQL